MGFCEEPPPMQPSLRRLLKCHIGWMMFELILIYFFPSVVSKSDLFFFTPEAEDALPCGSRSISNVLRFVAAMAWERLTAVVVFPTPPFWFEIDMIFTSINHCISLIDFFFIND